MHLILWDGLTGHCNLQRAYYRTCPIKLQERKGKGREGERRGGERRKGKRRGGEERDGKGRKRKEIEIKKKKQMKEVRKSLKSHMALNKFVIFFE